MILNYPANLIPFVEKALFEEDFSSALELGHIYDFGKNIEKDYEEAYYWYTFADQHHVGICYETNMRLGYLERNGLGTPQSLQLALRHFEYGKRNEASEEIRKYCEWAYEECHKELERQKEEAWRLTREGDPNAPYRLARLNYGYFSSPSYPDYETLFVESAKRGSLYGMYFSDYYRFVEDETGLEYLKRSAEGGFSKALSTVGINYKWGYRGFPVDLVKAEECARKAASISSAYDGFCNSYYANNYHLADDYFYGKYGKKRYDLAIKHYSISLKKDKRNQNIFTNIGECYFEGGNGVLMDKKKAFSYFGDASTTRKSSYFQGDSLAMTRMGDYYKNGYGIVNKNPALAFSYYQKACERNPFPEALYKVGLCYEEGFGVKQDTHQATLYFQKCYDLAKKYDVKTPYEALALEKLNLLSPFGDFEI